MSHIRDWLDIAEELPIGHKTRIKCCGSNKDAIIRHDYLGYGYYCFKCDTRIFHSVRNRTLDQLIDIQKLNNEPISVEIPEDFTADIPIQHCIWLYKAGVDNDTAMAAGIGWSTNLQRIILPIRDSNNKLLYYQCRAVHKGQLPKYKNPPISKSTIVYKSGWTKDRSRVVVTEDILSAIRVGKHTPACSIMGTKTSDDQAGILSQYDMVSYWLDPDLAGIKGSRDGAHKVGLATHTEILTSTVDPKNLPDRCIRQILKLPAQEEYTYHGCLTTTNTQA